MVYLQKYMNLWLVYIHNEQSAKIIENINNNTIH